MTIIYKHRVNTIKELCLLPQQYGVEVDIRSNGRELVVNHDPFSDRNIPFIEWIKHFNHNGLIVNVKEEGLEDYIELILEEFEISDYFFLDQSFPQVYKMTKAGNRHCSLRISEFENLQTVISMQNRIEWVWVDYFNHFPLIKSDIELLDNKNFKICIVSPELQGFDYDTTRRLIDRLNEDDIHVSAVCTKHIKEWGRYK